MGTIGGNLCLNTRCCFLDRSSDWRAAAGYCLKADGNVCRVAPGRDRCWAAMTSDLAPVLIALDAQARLVSARGERLVPVEDLYRDDGISHLAIDPAEILADVRLRGGPGPSAAYLKLRLRGAVDFPALGVAVALQLERGRCEQARIVLGAIASRPFRVAEAEQALVGRAPTAAVIEAAAEAAYREAHPVENLDLPLAYRRRMVRVLTGRAIRQAWSGG
jgi:4-hydroxybenzoyl-CoA reductase subunit beta